MFSHRNNLKRSQTVSSVFAILFLSITLLCIPFTLLSTSIFAGGAPAPGFSYDAIPHTFTVSVTTASTNTITYDLRYMRAFWGTDIKEGIVGSGSEVNGQFTKTLYAGTCSSGECISHQVMRGSIQMGIPSNGWSYLYVFDINADNGSMNILHECRNYTSMTAIIDAWLTNPNTQNLIAIQNNCAPYPTSSVPTITPLPYPTSTPFPTSLPTNAPTPTPTASPFSALGLEDPGSVYVMVAPGTTTYLFTLKDTTATSFAYYGYPTTYGPGISFTPSSGGIYPGNGVVTSLYVSSNVPEGMYSGYQRVMAANAYYPYSVMPVTVIVSKILPTMTPIPTTMPTATLTPSPTPTPTPTVKVLSLSGIQVSSVWTSTAQILWNTSIDADTKIVYGTSSKSLTSSIINPTLSINHMVNISGLRKRTAYYYRVISQSADGQIAQSAILTFTTPSK